MFFSPLGDSYRFTLQPIFPNPRTEFRCHVRRRRPELLYQVWFYVSLPSASFETARFRSSVRPSMTSSSGNGSHVIEFLTIDHVTGVQQLHDEFLLVGRRVERTTQTAHAWNFSVHSVKLVSCFYGAPGGGCCSTKGSELAGNDLVLG